jgi:2-dehydro-3-deoxygluconokinase
MRLVAIGECMVELAPVADGLLRPGFAGDTFNTAWHLRRRLGPEWDVDYLTAVGDDPLSDRMVVHIAAQGIGTDRVARVRGRTCGLYLISHENGDRRFAYWRGQSAARTLADDPDRLAAGLAGADAVYLSGITLAILPPEERATLLRALAAARTAGARVLADPNIRPALWEDPATCRAAIKALARLADILLPSFDDEAACFGDTDPDGTAARYASLGCAEVVVKNGAGAVTLRDATGTSRHPVAQAAQVVDTTGAGDAFNAGYLAERLSGAPAPDAIAAGAALGARTIGHAGAIPSEP